MRHFYFVGLDRNREVENLQPARTPLPPAINQQHIGTPEQDLVASTRSQGLVVQDKQAFLCLLHTCCQAESGPDKMAEYDDDDELFKDL